MTLPLANGFVDGARIASDLQLSPQVLIIGSGAGGAVAAHTLASAGLEVLVVEEGGHYTHASFDQREDTAYPRLYQEDGGRTTEDLAISILQGRAVGGTTVVNWTTSFRTPEEVVAHWRERHGVKGFTHAELVPHWEAVEQRLGIADIPLAQVNRNNRLLHDGCSKLGWEVKTLRRNVRGCLHTGSCGLGCPVNAKQSMLVTYLPDAVKQGAHVLSRCRIERLELENGRATRVVGTLLGQDDRTPTGRTVTITPKYVIVAAGGINTPALLLRSGHALDGRVGARTMLHPTTAVVALHEDAVLGWQGAPQSVASHQFAHRGDEVGYVLETAPIHPMLASIVMPGFGEAHAEGMAKLPFASGHIALHVDGFHDDVAGGRVKLRPSGAPVLAYELTERLLRAMRHSAESLVKVALAAGAISAFTPHDPAKPIERTSQIRQVLDSLPWQPNRFAAFTAHVMGGSALNDEPSKGVVGSDDFRVHGLENVHVIDGSLFPTSLGVNPQLTIYGLARLASTRLAAKWGVA